MNIGLVLAQNSSLTNKDMTSYRVLIRDLLITCCFDLPHYEMYDCNLQH